MAYSRNIRSLLFVPTDKLKFMEKSILLNSDAIIFDLEDSVATDKKIESRLNIIQFFDTLHIHNKVSSNKLPYCAIRINCPHSSIYGKDDIDMIKNLKGLDVLVLPKVDDYESLNETVSLIAKPISLWAMIETSLGVINVEKIAAHKSVGAIVFGCNDLTKDIKAKFNSNRNHLHYSMSKCIIAARAAKKLVFDGVYMDITDKDGLISDCITGKSFGFDGKSLIHPNQIDITNEYFSPSMEDVEYARRVVAAYANARAEGKSLAVLDGKLIEYLHVHEASAVIRQFNELEKNRHK